MRGFVRGAAQIRHATCRCGLTIVANDLEKKISHEVPECAWFKDLVAKAGGGEGVEEIISVADILGEADGVLRIKPMPATTLCQVHDWPTKGMGKRLFLAMREAHGKGGVNVCVECVARAKGDAAQARGKA